MDRFQAAIDQLESRRQEINRAHGTVEQLRAAAEVLNGTRGVSVSVSPLVDGKGTVRAFPVQLDDRGRVMLADSLLNQAYRIEGTIGQMASDLADALGLSPTYLTTATVEPDGTVTIELSEPPRVA